MKIWRAEEDPNPGIILLTMKNLPQKNNGLHGMFINNCLDHPQRPGQCVAMFLGRLSFQPLRENPLFGPSSSTYGAKKFHAPSLHVLHLLPLLCVIQKINLGQGGSQEIFGQMNKNHETMVLVEQYNAGKSDLKEIEEKSMEETSLADLLLGGAEAENWHLASLIIARLNHLLPLQDNGYNPFNRLASFFTQGLHYKTIKDEPVERLADNNMAAFQMLQELSPYIKFAHFTENQAILEATKGEPEVHVLDF